MALTLKKHTKHLKIVNGKTAIDDSDKEMFTLAVERLQLYQEAFAELPNRKWLALSYANVVTWRQIEAQRALLNGIIKDGYIPEMEE